jgi:hypothetical protein
MRRDADAAFRLLRKELQGAKGRQSLIEAEIAAEPDDEDEE